MLSLWNIFLVFPATSCWFWSWFRFLRWHPFSLPFMNAMYFTRFLMRLNSISLFGGNTFWWALALPRFSRDSIIWRLCLLSWPSFKWSYAFWFYPCISFCFIPFPFPCLINTSTKRNFLNSTGLGYIGRKKKKSNVLAQGIISFYLEISVVFLNVRAQSF